MSKNRKKNESSYSKTQLFGLTTPYILKSWPIVLIQIILTIGVSYLITLAPIITKRILDDYISNSLLSSEAKINGINSLLISYAIIALLTAACRYFLSYTSTLVSMNIEKGIREEALRKINDLPVDYFSLEPDGKIVAKITADSNGVRNFYVMLSAIVQAVTTLIAVYIGIIYLNLTLALYMLTVVPLVFLWLTVYRARVRNFFVRMRETSSKITGKLNELITGALIIQAYNKEELMQDEYQELVTDYTTNDKKVATITAYFGFELLVLLRRMLEAGILLFFGFQYFELGADIITIGLVTAITTLIERMIIPIMNIFNSLNDLEDSMVAASRVYELLHEANDLRVNDGEKCLGIEGKIEFQDVSFYYVDEKYVLSNINLSIDKNKTIGIVGHTGSGKSSMMNLLMGYNDNQHGSILVDGVDIKTYNKKSYREHCGIVLQTPALFAGTIKSNVTMERDFADEEVIDVLTKVGATHLIKKDELGIHAGVSFKGENLSLGEKQLIAFARILLRNPKILVLDEATANIDTKTELQIKEAMKIITKNRTTFIIAHRLSTIKEADEIMVLDKGCLLAKGSHDYLYETCAVYKDMYDSQYKNT